MELSFHGRKRAQKSFLEEMRSQESPRQDGEKGAEQREKTREGLPGKLGGKPKINFETSSPCLEWAIIMISRLT